MDWFIKSSGEKETRINIGEFTLFIEALYDYDHDFTQGRGHFANSYEKGAIKVPQACFDSGYSKYFVPDTSLEKSIKDYLSLGLTLQDARKRAAKESREDMAIASDPEREGYYAMYVFVTCIYKEIELATSALFGIELAVRHGDSYLDSITDDLVQECLLQAKAKLAELRA